MKDPQGRCVVKAIVATAVSVDTGGATDVLLSVEKSPGIWWRKKLVVHHDGPLHLERAAEVELSYFDDEDPTKGYALVKE